MPNPTEVNDAVAQLTAKSVEVYSLWADASHKVLRELVDLSASSAKEGVRLYSEIQAALVEATKEGQAFLLRRQSEIETGTRDPLGSYQKHLLESVEGAQKAFRLLEGNAQAMTRSAERLQVTAEQTAREIQTAFAQLTGKVKSLYTPAA